MASGLPPSYHTPYSGCSSSSWRLELSLWLVLHVLAPGDVVTKCGVAQPTVLGQLRAWSTPAAGIPLTGQLKLRWGTPTRGCLPAHVHTPWSPLVWPIRHAAPSF